MDVVFILSSIINPNSIKRVNEFVNRGYNVQVYGFDRLLSIANKPDKVEIIPIGIVNNSSNYFSRCKVYIKGIKRVLRDTKTKNCIYFVIGFDVMIYFKFLSCKKYIYEEPDLVYANSEGVITKFFGYIDRFFIKHSLLTVFRSEGFIKFHYNCNPPINIRTIANRLNKNILKLNRIEKKQLDITNLQIGFVGLIRYQSIFKFAEIFCKNFPQHTFHFYGTFGSDIIEVKYNNLRKYTNCVFHGPFTSPGDLPEIYSNLDLLLSTYDVSNINVRYAEPNKIYEAIYFETPIIVSNGTFLSEKVFEWGIGYSVDALDEKSVVNLVKKLSIESIKEKIDNIQKIPKDRVLNINDAFFNDLEKFGIGPNLKI